MLPSDLRRLCLRDEALPRLPLLRDILSRRTLKDITLLVFVCMKVLVYYYFFHLLEKSDEEEVK